MALSETMDIDVFEKGVSLGLYSITREAADTLCESETKRTGCKHDWHYVAGRVHVKYLPNGENNAQV